MQSEDRAYFRRRSIEEIYAAMQAETIEATNADIGLAELHLRQCADCIGTATEECGDCLAGNICVRRDSLAGEVASPGRPNGRDRRRRVDGSGVAAGDPASLSTREQRVLCHVARGLSFSEVGDALGTSAGTVGRCLGRMRTKLGARNTAHLITRAVVAGILTLPTENAADALRPAQS